MAVRIGQSYVSETAYSFVKSQVDGDENILKNLREKFPNLKISVGTAPFSGSGINNLSISPKILQEMQNNPDKKIEYEALIYDIANQNISQPGLKSHGFIIDDKGGLRGWGISEHNDKKISTLDKKNKKSWLENLLPQKNPKKFKNSNELVKNLQKNYSVVKNGAATISKNFLQNCLDDEEKQNKLFENLKAAEEIYKNAEKGKNVRIKIDSEGNMTVESSKTTVGFNESKRARQLAAAKTIDDIQFVLNLLQNDLAEVEEGLKNNWCDEKEVEKVKKMIEKAKQLLGKVDKDSDEKNSVDILI